MQMALLWAVALAEAHIVGVPVVMAPLTVDQV